MNKITKRLNEIEVFWEDGEMSDEEAERALVEVCTDAIQFAWRILCAAQLLSSQVGDKSGSDDVSRAIHEQIVALEVIKNKMKEVGQAMSNKDNGKPKQGGMGGQIKPKTDKGHEKTDKDQGKAKPNPSR